MVVDPWGVVVARAGDGERVVVAEIDRERLRRIRRELPSLANARLS
jgi:predicted amidohydrolase